MQLWVALDHPGADCTIEFPEMSDKKVIRILHEDEPSVSRCAGDDLLDLFPGPVFIECALHDELGFVATLEIGKL